MNMKCGYIGIIGRPNVGKSTLLNHMVGMKVSVTSSKPQTTREQILGIHTTKDTQYIFIDTPGFHAGKKKYANRLMNRAARTVIEEAEILLWVVECRKFTSDDEAILEKLRQFDKPLMVALNKQDQVDEASLFALTHKLSQALPHAHFVPCSAKTGFQVAHLLALIRDFLPDQPFIYPEEMVTDKDEKFYAKEVIREKIMRQTGEELPYACSVEIDQYRMEKNILHIVATLFVDKESQKPILIGKGGERLKIIGQEARLDLEKFWDQKIFLKLWVKVKKHAPKT